MTTTSTNLGLTLFNSTTDATTQTFLQYRTAVAGTGATSNFNKIDALFEHTRTYKVDNFGTMAGTAILTMDVSPAASSLGVMANIILTGYDLTVLAIYNGYAYCSNVGTTFTIGTMDVFKNILGSATAPFLTWEGTGTSRTLYLWNNQAFSQMTANVTNSGYGANPIFA